MSNIVKFTRPFRISRVDLNTLDLVGNIFEGLNGFSQRQSWEDERRTRYFPFCPWLSNSDATLVLLKDAHTRRFQELLLMSRDHAYDTGMPRPKIIQIGTTPKKGG
jgi:hypothetical protein